MVTCMLLIGLTSCGKKEQTLAPDIDPLPQGIRPADPTPTPLVMTPAPGITQSPIITVTPTPVPVVKLSAQDALEKVKEAIDSSIYTIVMEDQTMNIEDGVYYRFDILEGDVKVEPSILVNVSNGTLYCYDVDCNLSLFEKFPLDKVESIESGSKEITKEEAFVLLQKLSQAELGLPKALSEYLTITDDWTTIVEGGDNCYCFNIHEKDKNEQLVAVFYVSLSGNAIYKLNDELGQMVKIQ